MACAATAESVECSVGGSGPGGGRITFPDLDTLVAELVAAGCEGGSWRHVNRYMGLREYHLLQDHWARHGSPVYMLVAGYLGWKAPTLSDNQSGDDKSDYDVVDAAEAFEELAALMGMSNG